MKKSTSKICEFSRRGPLNAQACKKFDIVSYKLDLVKINVSVCVIWLFAVFGWYSWAYSTNVEYFRQAKEMGSLFSIPAFVSLSVWLFIYYDQEISSKRKMFFSAYTRKSLKMLYSCFATSSFYGFYMLIVIMVGYKKEIVPFYESDSNFLMCWENIWTSILDKNDLTNPPSLKLGQLFNQTSCEQNEISDDVLNVFLDDMIFLRTWNYQISLMVGAVSMTWALRVLCYSFMGSRHTDPPTVNEKIFQNAPVEVRSRLVTVYRWIDNAVSDTINGNKGSTYYSLFPRNALLSAIAICLLTSVYIEYLSRPSDLSLNFMIVQTVPLYGGQFWSVFGSFPVQLQFYMITGLVCCGIEWVHLYSTVFVPTMRLQMCCVKVAKFLSLIINVTVDPWVNENEHRLMGKLVLIRRWFLSRNIHAWYLVREALLRRRVLVDHRQSEFGIIAILGIGVVLLSQVCFTFLLYGFWGSGIFGPWTLSCSPFLIVWAWYLLLFSVKLGLENSNQVILNLFVL